MIGNFFRLLGVDIHAFRKDPLRLSVGHHLETLAAAHALLQIMAPFLKTVFYNGQHRIVPFRVESIAGADKNLGLITLRPRLIESFGYIVQVKRYEIDDTFPGDSQALALFQLKSRA
jgi:hypothetical protein